MIYRPDSHVPALKSVSRLSISLSIAIGAPVQHACHCSDVQCCPALSSCLRNPIQPSAAVEPSVSPPVGNAVKVPGLRSNPSR
ncbi:hypothetical protein RRG08_023658 [Elysia crispata]|uniref:Uncharacterized protein n=1 Tax=Elysia crispata TaxID=231223 RepID=A0AAE1CLN4_9GAST|nr:hypothetical protein RRG08_023658 [Elysia crispata]